MSELPLPRYVLHADWSKHQNKRWLARAELTPFGNYQVTPPEIVGELTDLLQEIKTLADEDNCVLIGFDFPIGLPLTYARKAGIEDFLSLLPELGNSEWGEFYTVAEIASEINLRRPFYPQRPGGTRQQQLLDGLSCERFNDLRRVCERARPGRRAAAPLFWTLGGQQVGKAAICGWRDLLALGLCSSALDLRIWPFSGELKTLLKPGCVVTAETYPTEVYTHLGIKFSTSWTGKRSGKRTQVDRASNASVLLKWAQSNSVQLDRELHTLIKDGFGPTAGGEDPFDATVGLFGMLNVLHGNQTAGEPDDPEIRKIEGWILGQVFQPGAHSEPNTHHV